MISSLGWTRRLLLKFKSTTKSPFVKRNSSLVYHHANGDGHHRATATYYASKIQIGCYMFAAEPLQWQKEEAKETK